MQISPESRPESCRKFEGRYSISVLQMRATPLAANAS